MKQTGAPQSIKALCEFIWLLEKRYGLLELEIDGIKVWQNARMHIYYHLAQELKIFSMPHTAMSRLEKWKVLFNYIRHTLFRHPFLASRADHIVFPHPRTKEFEGSRVDIYTMDITHKLLKEHKHVIELESPYKGQHQREPEAETYYEDALILFRQFSSLFRLKQVPAETIARVETEITHHCGITIDLYGILCKEAKRFKAEYLFYTKFLKKVSPKSIYLTVGYGKGALVLAAKEQKIVTIEVQHGTFSRYHLGYSFPYLKKPLSYFPERFLVWSSFWKTLIPLPIASENVIDHGFAYMQKEQKKLSHISKIEHQVLILSQGALGEKIAYEILKNIEVFQAYRIKYKLHPGEYERWHTNPSLKALSAYENIEIVKECNLYELMAQSRYQVGVFSTAIYEGLMFGCTTILLDLPGIEYMEDLLKNKIAVRYREGSKLERYL